MGWRADALPDSIGVPCPAAKSLNTKDEENVNTTSNMSQNSPNGAPTSGSKKSATLTRSLSPGAMAASRPARLGTPGARLSGGGTGRLGSSRLPSFKGQRDLTLGGTAPRTASVTQSISGAASSENKKKFVPNLKVQRRKEEMKREVREERTIDIPTATKGHVRDKQGGKANALSASGDGAATKSRPKPELIQTMAGSVFSEGVSGEGIRRKVGGGGGGGGGLESEPLRRPVLSKESKGSVDKEAEEKRLKALLRDDFISDLSSEGLYVPVQLPMIDTGKLFLAEEKDKMERDEENDDEDVIKATKKPRANRILDSDDDENDPPDPASTVEAPKEKSTVKAKTSGKSTAEDVDLTFQDLVRQQRGDLIFIQLPDHLPGIAMPVKKEPGTDDGDDDNVNGEGGRMCHLKDLPEGYLGKIQVRRSGKTQLKIGDALLDIDLGTQVGFLQDLVSVDTGAGADAGASHQEVGDMTVLGRVRHRMVITPDWDHLLKTGGNGGPMGGCDDSDEEEANKTKL